MYFFLKKNISHGILLDEKYNMIREENWNCSVSNKSNTAISKNKTF